MNTIGKGLVLLHAALSIAAMIVAAMVTLQFKDYGWMEPYRQVVEWTKDGEEKTFIRYASEYDKSVAAAEEAMKVRDLTYTYVKPALDSLRESEPYLPSNHLFFDRELTRLREATGEIEVKRFRDTGLTVEPAVNNLGKPIFEEKKLEGINKSYKSYQSDLKEFQAQIDEVEKEIRKIVVTTKKFTQELTGTDEKNKYVQPGLYQLTDLEYKFQAQIKAETDDIKPNWSKAIEQARLYLYRRVDLEATLDKLQAPLPKNPKK